MSTRRSEISFDDRRDHEYVVRRSRPPPEVLERDREEIRIREDSRVPAYVRDELARGTVVLRAREREEFEYPPPRRRSPSPERKVERESITIRRDREESRSRPPPPPPPPQERQREEIIIRREEDDTRPRRSYAPPRDFERDEIIIRREEDDKYPPKPRSEYSVKAHSRERERSTVRHSRKDSDSEHEIIIRRDEREGRRGEREREEIIIRHRSRSRSSSPARSVAPSERPPPEPQIINAPQIHQEVITHHRHIDHGYEVAIPQRRAVSRPPSPPSPPPQRERSEERISIHRSGERNGRSYHDDLVIDRAEGARSAPPPRELHEPPPMRDHAPPRNWRDDRDIYEEAEYYNQIALRRSHPGEAYHGATRDWELVDVPPGTNRVRMDGVGGGAQEISWQRYNGARKARFYPEAEHEEDIYASYEVERAPAPPPAPAPVPTPTPQSRGDIGGRYGRAKDPKEGLWTEITKDLVVKEAIQEMGYEFEESEEFYYIIANLKYEDVARLVGLSEDIRKDRRKRVKEMEWENRVAPEPAEEPKPRPAIEAPPARSKSPWAGEDERYIEREIIYRGGRPPPPVGWRR